MNVAIVQPYFFPYLGYFELINKVDCFVFLDDVNYIKKGWINRNKIVVNDKELMLTIPLIKASINKKINETYICHSENWQNKLWKNIIHGYGDNEAFRLIGKELENLIRKKYRRVSELAEDSVKFSCEKLNINQVEFVRSSELDPNSHLGGTERIIHLCELLHAETYINPTGGKDLYVSDDFKKKGITLEFMSEERTLLGGEKNHYSILHNLLSKSS